MSAFDWVALFENIGLPHMVGPSETVRRNHVGINCPLCGHDDKFFFSIDLSTGKVRGCWWDKQHWLSPVNLIMTLAGVDRERALKMLRESDPLATGDVAKMLETFQTLDAKPTKETTLEIQQWPVWFKKFELDRVEADQAPFERYLKDRGFPLRAAWSYGLRWATIGKWQDRIIFPLRSSSGALLGWTARSIDKRNTLRYLTHPPGDSVRSMIYRTPKKIDARVLVLCEGPFDAFKFDFWAGSYVQAIGLLGLNAGPEKYKAIAKAAADKEAVFLLLDKGTERQAIDLQTALATIGPKIMLVPDGVKDPGDMDNLMVRSTVKQMLATL